MRKGIVRIVFGIGMICLQIMSFVGNSNSTPLQLDLFTLFFLIGYLLPGICGVVSLFWGLVDYNSGDTAMLILHTNTKKQHKIIKNTCVSLLFFYLLYIVFIHLIRDHFEFTGLLLLSIFSVVLLLLYLMLYHGKKPTYLFASAIIFAGMYNLYSSLYGVLRNMAVTSIPYLAIGILYILIGTKLCKEIFSPKHIRILGAIVFVIEMMMVIYYRLKWFAFIPFIIDIILPLTIFVYTCIIPVCNEE